MKLERAMVWILERLGWEREQPQVWKVQRDRKFAAEQYDHFVNWDRRDLSAYAPQDSAQPTP